MNPGVSTTAISGSPKALHSPTKDAAEMVGLIGDDADRAPVDPREGRHDVPRPARVELEQRVGVDDPGQRVADVVGAPRLRRDDGAGIGQLGLERLSARRGLAGRRGQVGEQATNALCRRRLIGLDEMTDAVAIMHVRTAERGRIDLLAECLAHDAGAGEEHGRVLGHHGQVGQRRRVGAAARRGA